METVRRASAILERVETFILALLFSLLVALSFFQVILREFFSLGIVWADTFLRHLVLWVGFLGAALAVRSGGHFAIDAVKKAFPERQRRLCELVSDLAALACLGLLTRASLRFFRDELNSGSVLFTAGDLAVPGYVMNAILPAGFLLLFLHFALKAAEDAFLLAGPARGRAEGPPA